MPEDFGVLNIVASPFLERIGKEEKLGDQARKPKNMKSPPIKRDSGSAQPDTPEKTDDSTSSQHIDLRI